VDPVAVLELLHGAATRRQLLARTGRGALGRALAAGEIVRVGRGRYALPTMPDPVKIAVALHGRVSHATAAELWKLSTVRSPASVHVTVPRHAHRRSPERVTLHYAPFEDHHVLTPVLRTVLDCARSMPFREGLAIADSALRDGHVRSAELRTAARAVRGPGAASARRVVEHADARAANAFESALRAEGIEAGLTGFEPQFAVPGLPYRVDLADPARRIVLEADSFAHHGSRDALERDCRRYDELVRARWTVLRFSWEHVMFQARWVRGLVLDVHDREDQWPGRLRSAG
jgi:very-short-patch-repair endonuclease